MTSNHWPYLPTLTLLCCNLLQANAAGTLSAWGGGQTGWPPNSQILQISSAVDHSLALADNGTVAAWGYNFSGQSTIPAGLTGVTQVAAGDYFSLALKADGTLVAWGANDYGQCVIPPGLSGVVAISAGHAHCLALKANGSVIAWGSDAFGQSTVPVGLTNVSAVVAAWNHSLALKNDGTVMAWGLNDSGQCAVPGGLANVKAIAGNLNYSLALKKDGTVVGWGRVPSIPPGLTGITAIAAGESHCLALKSDGTVLAWGANASGETVPPGNLANVTAIGATWNFSTALVGSGFRLVNPQWRQNGFSATVLSQNGKTYVLEYKNSATNPAWTALPPLTGTGGMLTLTDPSANMPSRLYRLRMQ